MTNSQTVLKTLSEEKSDDELTTIVFLNKNSKTPTPAVEGSSKHLELLVNGFKPTWRGF